MVKTGHLGDDFGDGTYVRSTAGRPAGGHLLDDG